MDLSRLQSLILEHWTAHCPQMVRDLKSQGQLMQSLQEAESRAADLLHEFLISQRMQYAQAWEMATRESLLPQNSSPKTASRKTPPATSA